MNDIARIDLNNPSPIVHSVQTKSIRKDEFKITKKTGIFPEVSFQFHRFSLLVNKSVKRLALNCLSDSNRQLNISTEHVIRQLTSLTMNPKYSKNFSSNEILMISINSNEQCQVVRYINGKYFIPCFELSRILNLNENLLDKETVKIRKFPMGKSLFFVQMFSRIRIYQSNELFSRFIHMKNCCSHWRNVHRPYLFLFLISSLIPFLKSLKILNSIVQTFEQLIIE